MKEPFDDTAKQFYRRFFENLGVSQVESEKEVFFQSRRIDLVIECNEEDIARLQGTAFAHFDELNGLEVKGPNDPFTLIDFNRALMRIWGLGAMKALQEEEKDISKSDKEQRAAAYAYHTKPVTVAELPPHELYALPKRRTLTVITVICPLKILKWLKEEFEFRPVEPGVYHYDGQISQWIICPSDLRIIPKNYPLLPLSKGKKLRDFIDHCLKEGLFNELQLVMDVGVKVDPDTLWQKINEVRKMATKIRPETLRYIDEFFRDAPDFLDDVPFIQEKMADYGQQRERRGERRGKQEGEQHARQQILLSLLRKKFASVPQYVVHQVESTTDQEQLTSWLEQILSANTLQEMGFGLSAKNGKNGANGTNGSH